MNPTTASPPPLRLQLAGALLLCLGLGWLGQWLLVDQRELTSGLIVWAAAVAAFWMALRLPGARPYDSAETTSQPSPISPRLELALFAIVLLVGVFMRLYRIESIPAGLNHDAAWNGLYAIKITDGIGYSPFVDCCGAFGHETMFHYVIAALQLAIGPVQLAIEGASALLGILTLGVFYLLTRKAFGVRVALVATFLLAASGWHITFSRAGWHAILIPLFEALVFYTLLLALDSKRSRAWPFVIAGIMLGLSLGTYDAAKTIPLSVGVFLLYMIITQRDFLRRQLKGLVVYGLTSLIAFAPLGYYIAGHWESYMGRSRALWIGQRIQDAGSLHPLFDNLLNGVLIFNFRARGDDFFVAEPLLDLPVSIFFVLGLVYSLTRLRQPMHFMLLCMLLLSMTNGFLSLPNGNRGIGATLPVMTYAALFLVIAFDWLREPVAAQARRFAYAGAFAGVLAVVAWLTFSSYLGPDRRDQWGFYPDTTRVGRFMETIAPDYQIYAAAGNWPRDSLTYLSYQGQPDPFQRVYTYFTQAGDLLSQPPAADKGTAFIVEATGQNAPVLKALSQRFPTAATGQVFYNDGGANRLVANVLLVPRGAEPQPYDQEPLTPPQAANADQQRRADLERIAVALKAYRARVGTYPSTNGNLQTACVFPDLDQLCRIATDVGRETLTDPRGDAVRFGYWYVSDGGSFSVYASFEATLTPDETCRTNDASLRLKPNLYCVSDTD